MPNDRSGRSRTWPIHAFTTKPGPRILWMVFALAGASTMTTGLPLGAGSGDFFRGLFAAMVSWRHLLRDLRSAGGRLLPPPEREGPRTAPHRPQEDPQRGPAALRLDPPLAG